MLSEQQRNECDPAAIQRELLQIEQEVSSKGIELIHAKTEAMRLDYEVKILKERKSILQSVLKSISQF